MPTPTDPAGTDLGSDLGTDAGSDAGPPEPPAHRQFAVRLALIAALGLLGRIAYTLLEFGRDRELFDEGDAFLYSAVAHNTARGNWFQNPFDGSHFADHPPLTVAVLTPTSWLFRDSVLAQRITMALLGTAAVVVIGLLARSLVGPTAGLVAAAVAALNPNLWMNDALVMSESLSALLIALLLWSVVGLRRDPSLLRAAGCGALCGLTVLARAEIGLFLPLLIAPTLLLATARSWRHRLTAIALAGVALVVVVAPWTAWNSAEFREPVVVSTNDGTALLGSYNPTVFRTGVVGGWSLQEVLAFNERERVAERGLDASEISREQRAEAMENLADDVGRLPVVLVARQGRTFGYWRPDQQAFANQGEGRPKWATWAGYVTFWLLVPVSVVGARALRRAGAGLLPALACLATVVVVTGLFYGIARFRLPLDVMTCVLAGAAAGAMVRAPRSAAEPSGPAAT